MKQLVEGCIASRWQSGYLSGPEPFLTSRPLDQDARLLAFLGKFTWLQREVAATGMLGPPYSEMG